MSDWRVVFNLRDIPVLGSRRVATPMGDIAVHRTADDRIYAVEDSSQARQGDIQLVTADRKPSPATEMADTRRFFDVHVSDGVILLNMAGMGFEVLAS
ncbi:MAG: hypothetical protein EP335_08460 [Alphaproteobacteria bacterium]|nr:MAG: hypothetical protein EP335_08460 [Alphaproteobacteria bacterium]